MVGDVAVNIFAMLDWLGGRLGGRATEEGAFIKILFEQIRGPRIVLAAMTGFVLGLAGAAVQGLFRNPLAEPGLLGASNGAALGAVMVIYSGLATTLSFAVPLAAALMALLSVLILLALAGKGASSLRLILAGFAVSAFAGAGIALALNLSPNYFAALEIAFWLLGAVENRSWLHVALAAPGAVLGCLLMWRAARPLDGLSLGEEVARSLGINMARLRLQISIGLGAGSRRSGVGHRCYRFCRPLGTAFGAPAERCLTVQNAFARRVFGRDIIGAGRQFYSRHPNPH